MPRKQSSDLYKVPHRKSVVWHCDKFGNDCYECAQSRINNAEEYITKIRAQYRELLVDIGKRKEGWECDLYR